MNQECPSLWKKGFKVIILILLLTAGLTLIKTYSSHSRIKLFGYSFLVVTSGSMEPVLTPGDLIIVQAQSEYRAGEIVTYPADGFLVTHRIKAIVDENLILQGDANNAADPHPVPSEQILGKVVLIVPWLGHAALFLKTPAGFLSFLAAGFLMECGLSHLSKKRKGVSE